MLWKSGDVEIFRFGNWQLELRREEDVYEPFKFSVNGYKLNTNETIGRRYTSMEKAFLHILNRFNEDANIKNRYNLLLDIMNSSLPNEYEITKKLDVLIEDAKEKQTKSPKKEITSHDRTLTL